MKIEIRGASEHNLKGIDVDIGAGLTVVTGVSGSGKTSLVFDTLYHEARRRLLDVLAISRPGGWSQPAAPARVESISGLGPAIAVGQNVLNRNPLSTLASASGLYPFLRLLYSRLGTRRCAQCGTQWEVLSEDELVERLVALAVRGPVQVCAPLLHGVMGSHRTLLELLARELGAEALRVDGRVWQGQPPEPGQPHDLEVELGRLEGAGPDWALPAIFTLLGLVFAPIGGVLFFRGLRGVLRQLRLQTDGTRAEATVVEVEETNLRLNGVVQWRIRYRYQDHRGRTHAGDSGTIPPEEAEPWKVGDRGVIRFDPHAARKSIWVGRE